MRVIRPFATCLRKTIQKVGAVSGLAQGVYVIGNKKVTIP